MPLFKMKVSIRRTTAVEGEVPHPGFDLEVEGDHPSEQAALEYVVGMARVCAGAPGPADDRPKPVSGTVGTPDQPRLSTKEIPHECPRCGHEGDGPYPWWDGDGRCPKCQYPDAIKDLAACAACGYLTTESACPRCGHMKAGGSK